MSRREWTYSMRLNYKLALELTICEATSMEVLTVNFLLQIVNRSSRLGPNRSMIITL